MQQPNMILKIMDDQDLESLFRVFEELRDVQDVGLSLLPKYCSGWKEADTSTKNSMHLVRVPEPLDRVRTLNVGVRVDRVTGNAEIIIRME